MSLGANKQALMGAAGAAGGGDFYTHQIAKSVRVPATSSTSSNNGRLTRTFGTVDSSVHWTLNFWIKRSALEGINPVSSARPLTWFTPRNGTSGSVLQEFKFCSPTAGGTAGDALMIVNTNSNAIVLSTDNLFRDTSAWYNIHIQADLDNGTNSERLKYFINGTEASYNTDNRGSYTSLPGITAGAWTIGDYYNYGYPIQCYFAQWAYVDGTTYAPTDFGETKNGVWIPKDLSSGITWGSAGHLLDFADSSALGNDVSGNNNDWTTANIDTHDQMPDTPTFNSSSNGGNFATIGGLEKNTGGFTFSEGNLKYAVSTNQRGFIFSQGVPDSGKYYWEVRVTQFGGAQDDVYPGVCVPDITRSNLTGDRGGATVSGGGAYTVNLYNGAMVLNGVFQSNDAIGNKRAVPQTVGIAIDRDNNTFKWTYDGSSYSSTYAIPSSGVLAPFLGSGGGSNTASGVFNFGSDSTFAGLISAGGNADENGFGDFSLAVPTGYLALCAGNLPVADAINPSETDDNYPQKLFGATIWTGDGSTSRAITGLGFQPDWVWFKNRSSAYSNRLYDTSRGISGTGGKRLFSNTDAAEVDQTSGQDISAVGTDGFTLGASSNLYTNDTNSGGLQVNWTWRANGGTETTNNVGTQTSYTQTDPSGAFSITRYAGTGSAMTVGHGLSVEPKITIIKDRDAVVDWVVYTKAIDGSMDYFIWNDHDASGTSGLTGPNSSVWTWQSVSGFSNTSGRNYIMYNFANVEGYCKVGTYVGNANDDGSFVYTGFKPAFFMCKPVVTGNWRIQDNKRTPFNVADKTLFPNRSDAELSNSSNEIDIVSNGVKMRASDSDYNQATTFLYLAMAENPFKYATAR